MKDVDVLSHFAIESLAPSRVSQGCNIFLSRRLGTNHVGTWPRDRGIFYRPRHMPSKANECLDGRERCLVPELVSSVADLVSDKLNYLRTD